MATLGRASVILVPKFEGLSAAVRKQLKEVEGHYEGSGAKAGGGFGKGLLSSAASFGLFTNLAGRAMDTVSSHVGDAVARFDTLNNYPKVMQSLGYSATDAGKSIATMSDRLSSLPTRLDDMASTVQGLAVITGDLDQATAAGLALNDMLIASGSSTQVTAAAMEQFRQMLSKGKPDMQDWKSIVSAMPGQMDQLAKSMLGAGANAGDLYEALGGGGKEARISIGELLDEIIRLDAEGGEGFESFRSQAETAAGGIATSASNAANAVTKGIAKTLDAIGRENIAGVFADVKDAVNDVSGAVSGAVAAVAPALKGVYETVRPLAPIAAKTAAAFMAFRAVGGVVGAAAGAVRVFGEQATLLGGVNAVLGASLSPVTLGLGLLTGAVSLGVAMFTEAQHKAQSFEKATRGLSAAVADSVALSDYSATIKDVGRGAQEAALSVGDLMDSIGSHVDKINENNEAARAQIAQLNTAQKVLNESIGATDLNADAQGRLEWAVRLVNDQLGLSITQQDVLAGKYSDASGTVIDMRDSVNRLIEAKKEEARVSALTANLTELYEAQAEAQKTYAAERKKHNDAIAEQVEMLMLSTDLTYAEAEAQVELDTARGHLSREYEEATEALRKSNEAVAEAEEQLGTLSAATSASADAYDQWAGRLDGTFEQILITHGQSISALKDDLREMGVDTTQLANLEDAELYRIADAYRGTSESIRGRLAEAGVAIEEYNGIELEGKDGKVEVEDSSMRSALGNIRSWRNVGDFLGRKYGEVVTTVTQIVGERRNAAGGIRLNAAGGIRYHAEGAIATRAAPLDIVGEDGAEAIVPLTNRRYSQPFIDLIAEGVKERVGGGAVYNMYLDGSAVRVDDRVADAMERFVEVVVANCG